MTTCDPIKQCQDTMNENDKIWKHGPLWFSEGWLICITISNLVPWFPWTYLNILVSIYLHEQHVFKDNWLAIHFSQRLPIIGMNKNSFLSFQNISHNPTWKKFIIEINVFALVEKMYRLISNYKFGFALCLFGHCHLGLLYGEMIWKLRYSTNQYNILVGSVWWC